MKLFRLAVSALCITAVSVVLATGTTANCSWSPPTTYNDGSALSLSDIDHYTLSWAPAAGQQGPSGSLTIPASSTKAPVTVPCGSTTFVVSVTTTATARYPGETSGPSTAVPYASDIACTPNPPTGLGAQ